MNNRQLPKENMLGVLMYLFENHMKSGCEVDLKPKQLFLELQHVGFKQDAIQKAFNWLEELTLQQNIILQNPPQEDSIRIFSNDECKKISKSCRNLLFQLEKLKILNAANREIVISLLTQLDEHHINPSQVKWVVLMVLFNQPNQREILWYLEHLILSDKLNNKDS